MVDELEHYDFMDCDPISVGVDAGDDLHVTLIEDNGTYVLVSLSKSTARKIKEVLDKENS